MKKMILTALVSLSANVFAVGATLEPVKVYEGIFENPDGSYTIIEPRIHRGNKVYPFYYSSPEGVCSLFGFNSYYSGSVVESEKRYPEVVDVTSRGEFDGIWSNYHGLDEVTCHNSEIKPKGVVAAETISENPDGSYTIIEPRIHRRNKVYPFYYSSPEGVCSLFGFNSYYSGSVVESEKRSEVVDVHSGGEFYATWSNSKGLAEVTCYEDGALNPVVSAGGAIYYRNNHFNNNPFNNKGIENYQID